MSGLKTQITYLKKKSKIKIWKN